MVFVMFGKGRILRSAKTPQPKNKWGVRQFSKADDAAAFVKKCKKMGFRSTVLTRN